jgi:Na+/H+ antiporter NhaD/arsenite permease-like protein
MIEIGVLMVFIIGYLGITLEHTTKIDKLIPALLMMTLSWVIIALGIDTAQYWFDPHHSSLISLKGVEHETRMSLLESTMLHHFGKTAEILIFLMGAMAIVEMIEYFNGFYTIKRMIKTTNRVKLLWIVSILAFLLSSIIDNLTATIVLITILRKIIRDQQLRMWYVGFIIIAANAGGAWSPIGDVTTTMLWLAKKVSTVHLIMNLIIPSLLCIVIPLSIASFLKIFKGSIDIAKNEEPKQHPYGSIMFYVGLVLMIFVPIFKTLTHLPPYIGMMLSLSLFALIAEYLSKRKVTFTTPVIEGKTTESPTMKALAAIEMSSVLFFLGILMTVASMESLGMIFNFGNSIRQSVDLDVFIPLLGIASAIIDNVPLVAASIGMFSDFPIDDHIWHFIAYAAGTGGSMLIIGSAAGVVAMGMEKISFFWYLKNISLLAFLGFIGGTIVFLLFTPT